MKRRDEPARSRAGVTVLHVDDDPNDTVLLQAASLRADVHFELHNAGDCEQAMAYLSGVGPYADRSRYRAPALILLDLKMPRGDGFCILRWIRQHPQWKQLPVVVLSGSQLKADMQHAYAEGANSYLVKPIGFDDLVKLVREVNAAWLATQCPMPRSFGSTELGMNGPML